MNNPWVVIINPTDEGATSKPSLITLRTGAMMLPAIMVRVAEERITPRVSLLELIIFTGSPLKATLSPYLIVKNTERSYNYVIIQSNS
jgi:hypothetical protein